MKIVGSALWAVAVLMAWAAERLATAVPAEGFPTGVANLQLLTVQTEITIYAAGLGICGSIFLAAGFLGDKIGKE